jgi:hypothetical protein
VKRVLYFIVPALLLLLLYERQCTSRKLAEATFYKDAFVELKVVQRFENLPLHYQGKVVSVACKSSQTRGIAAHKHDFVEAGWNVMPRAPMRLTGKTLEHPIGAWAKAAKAEYLVTDKMTIVIPGHTDVWMSWDGCRTFVRWDVRKDFPQELVVETNPAHQACMTMFAEQQAKGTPMHGDCYYSRWRGDGIAFSKLVAKHDGSARFQMRSDAFRGTLSYTVSTDDFGKAWQTTSP